MNTSLANRLAVCSWSLQPQSARQLISEVQQTGLARVQLALDPLRENPSAWSELGELASRAGITFVSGMFGCVGEDYSTMDNIRRTGGIVPDHTWDQNWRNIQAEAVLAEKLGLKLVTFHAGFLPHESKDPNHAKLLQRLRQVADCFAERRIDLALETGQETGETLRAFLQQVERPNVGVNFDPANMILYDKGNPVEALKLLGPWLKQCHIKDARRTRVTGTWGDEVVAGTGEVPWPEFFQTLAALSYRGWFCIEREAGQQRVQDIRTARQMVENVK